MPAMTELDHPVSTAPLDSEDGDEPTQFQLKSSGYQRNSLAQVFTVDAEYQKYALGELSSSKMDILRFWEVRYTNYWMVQCVTADKQYTI